MSNPTRMIAVLPTNNLEASVKFYELLGFRLKGEDAYADYQMLIDCKGAELHLTKAPDRLLLPNKNLVEFIFMSTRLIRMH